MALLKPLELLFEKLELLELLIKGCHIRPAYRAIRPSTGTCLFCVEMWNASQQLSTLTQQQKDER